ncbi:MAG: hypothetical protein PQJ49_08100 [Sphaerochaetaceae bacterium]|nr:hypothetical protein [Sphaerochaetaceae bacterium]
MELENAIKNNLLDSLEVADKLLEKIDSDKAEMNSLVNQIIEKDKKGEDCKELINKQRALVAVSYLLNDDLSKRIAEVAGVYKVAKSNGIELGFSDIQNKRLEFTLKNQVHHFLVEKGKIVTKDPDLLDKINAGITNNKKFTHNEYLENLRKLPIYGEKTNK